MMVAIRLVGLPEEFTPDQERPIANRIKDPHGNTLEEATGTFALDVDSARPDFLAGATLATGVRFTAPEEGTYALEFEFGEAWASLPIHVIQGPPPGSD